MAGDHVRTEVQAVWSRDPVRLELCLALRILARALAVGTGEYTDRSLDAAWRRYNSSPRCRVWFDTTDIE